MKTTQPTEQHGETPFRGTFITSNSRKNINSAIKVIDMNTGSSFPVIARNSDPSAASIHSRAVEYLNSDPMANTVASTTNIIIIIGMKLGER